MINTIADIFSNPIMVKAIIVGLLVSLCASLLGVILVLKKFALIGDGLSDVSFGSMAIAITFGWSPIYVSIPIVILGSLLLLRIEAKSRINNDSAIAILGSSVMAIGLAFSSLNSDVEAQVNDMMFGSILSMSDTDVYMSIIVSLLVCTMYIVYYRKIFLITFDQEFSKAIGLNTGRYSSMIAILTAIIIVVGMRIFGYALMSSVIIFPAIISMRLFITFKKVVVSSAVIGMISFLLGIFIFYLSNISIGASVVLVSLAFFLTASAFDLIKRNIK